MPVSVAGVCHFSLSPPLTPNSSPFDLETDIPFNLCLIPVFIPHPAIINPVFADAVEQIALYQLLISEWYSVKWIRRDIFKEGGNKVRKFFGKFLTGVPVPFQGKCNPGGTKCGDRSQFFLNCLFQR